MHVTADSRSGTTERTTEFRIDGRPATLAAACDLSVGGVVVAAGRDEPELDVLALRNDSTNVIDSLGGASTWAIGLRLRLPFGGCAWMSRGPEGPLSGGSFFVVGRCTFPGALRLTKERSVIANARRMVESAPRTRCGQDGGTQPSGARCAEHPRGLVNARAAVAFARGGA
jgi:hypothetical protein